MAVPEDFPKIPPSSAQAPVPQRANPAALTVAQLAQMLGLPEANVRAHIEAGAPTNPEGTINLIHYAAWLNSPGATPSAS